MLFFTIKNNIILHVFLSRQENINQILVGAIGWYSKSLNSQMLQNKDRGHDFLNYIS